MLGRPGGPPAHRAGDASERPDVSVTRAVLAPIDRPTGRSPWPFRHRELHGSDRAWAIAFIVPYAVVLLAFVLYPIGYGLWLGGDPLLYRELFSDPHYVRTAVNTLIYTGLAVNLQMFLALLLSGFFMRRRRWIKALLVVFILPWTLPAVPSFISFHWMLVGPEGLADRALFSWFGITGPLWFGNRWSALACNIVAYIWKWMPFWTLILIAGRMAIPEDLYDAAAVDGAGGYRRFVYVTLPLLANVYVISTLLATIWTIGDFTTVFFVSVGGPTGTSDVLATLGFQYALDLANPRLGIAAGLSALPLLIPIVILSMRWLHRTEVEL